MEQQQKLSHILSQCPQVVTATQAKQAAAEAFLSSKVEELNLAIGGGLAWGQLSEWGLPLGCGGRELLLPYLAQATNGPSPRWCLWVYPSRERLVINAASWAARGIQLKYLRYVSSDRPIHDLQPLLWDDFFRVLVFDMPKDLRQDECAFLARQAERHQLIVMVIRPYYLSSRKGNIWSRLRVNAWYDVTGDYFQLQVVRGLSPRSSKLPRTSLVNGGW